MGKILFIGWLLLSLVPFQSLKAQYYFYDNAYYNADIMFEGGISLGVMNCMTDLGGKQGLGKAFVKDLNIGNNQFNGSLYLGAIYREAIGLRIEGTYGRVKAYDSILKNVGYTTKGRYERNLSFFSTISEFSLIAEFYPLFMFVDWSLKVGNPPRLSPYLLGGIGYYSFNPKTKLNGKTVELAPLRTEGQGFAEYPSRKAYSLNQVNYPLGLGFKYEWSNVLNLRAEFVYRILTTDYLDDVSIRYVKPDLFAQYLSGVDLANAIALNDRRDPTNPDFPIDPNGGQRRGDLADKDAYFSFNIKLGFTFGRKKITTNAYERRRSY